MPRQAPKGLTFPALRYHGGKRNNSVVKVQYLKWRQIQSPPLPIRCDNPGCRFHTDPLLWNNSALPLMLEHVNGVNTDNRAKNLRLLCPNCDSQNSATRGGANARRVTKYSGGFAISDKGKKNYVLPVESVRFELKGG